MMNMRLPDNETHWLDVKNWVEPDPDPDYSHASAAAIEAFQDRKYGVRIHWGLYSMLQLQGESWKFLKMNDQEKQAYQQLYQRFNPQGFDANAWMELFQRVGLECFAITSKHHEGFSLWDTKTRVRQRTNYTAPGGPCIEDCDLAYSVMDTPFQRDILKELCDAAQRHGIMVDFYFSHPDWYDADFRPYAYHPLQTPRARAHLEEYGGESYPALLEKLDPNRLPFDKERTPEETERMLRRHRDQLTELLTGYGPIAMLCLDMWLGKDVWPQMRETIKHLRRLQPDVMLRARGIGNYGDYYTPEGFIPGSPSNTDMPWMVIYPLARSFSYDPLGTFYKGWRWIVRNIVDCAAKGGSFMVGIGPDENGRFHPQAVRDLEGAGQWLRVNGEAIYATRARKTWYEGRSVRFTRSKDQQRLYAISLRWPGKHLTLRSVKLPPGGQVSMLGYGPVAWESSKGGLTIFIPDEIQNRENRPCQYGCAFRIEGANE